eukprot:TRINITY_DN100900_c0_g1_i1.p1 TRINITY_DN100900_c0_g1~~TRINITY_DN100900_c0_g1_i1.p1  ORF type:complete len:729 (-),score=138.55 TRINITY_DN100900_c0_g1_i1:50-2182(-)
MAMAAATALQYGLLRGRPSVVWPGTPVSYEASLPEVVPASASRSTRHSRATTEEAELDANAAAEAWLGVFAGVATTSGCCVLLARRKHRRASMRRCQAAVRLRAGVQEAPPAQLRRKGGVAVRERHDWLRKVEEKRVQNVAAVRCRHLLLASEPMADEVLLKLRADPDSFASMAESLSLCSSTAKAGGDIGWVGQNDTFLDDLLPKPAREAVVLAQPGDLLKVGSERGWHLLRVDDVLLDLNVKHLLAGSVVASFDGETVASSLQESKGTYLVETMGCQMNVADSERMEGQLASLGLRKAGEGDEEEAPRVVVLNTCSIRDKAEQKVHAKLYPHARRKREGDDVTIVVSGCVAQQEGEQLLSQWPEVDAVIGPQYANRLADVLHECRTGGQVCVTDEARIMEDVTMPNRQSSVSAWVNVIYGCNERCTYCVVPTTRGSEQSRPMESVRRELQQLAAEGYREVTLLGQNIDAWGRDLTPKRGFGDLLRYLGDVEGIERIRFLTSHPRYISDDVVRAVRDTPSICEQFHIPFQSGDDTVLKNMERGYTHARFLSIVERIRSMMPDAGITADAIVGFPGETEEQFENTLRLMDEVRFNSCNTASYSPRPNTPAAGWTDSFLSEEVKKERLQRINAKAEQHALEKHQEFIGRTVEVLVDGRNIKRPSQVKGRTRQGSLCYLEGDIEELRGCLVPVRVTKAFTYSLAGEICGAPR